MDGPSSELPSRPISKDLHIEAVRSTFFGNLKNQDQRVWREFADNFETPNETPIVGTEDKPLDPQPGTNIPNAVKALYGVFEQVRPSNFDMSEQPYFAFSWFKTMKFRMDVVNPADPTHKYRISAIQDSAEPNVVNQQAREGITAKFNEALNKLQNTTPKPG